MKTKYQERLDAFLKEAGETPSSMEDKCKLGRSTINNALIGKTKELTNTTLKKITLVYPWLSIEWLTTGKGHMRKDQAIMEDSKYIKLESRILELEHENKELTDENRQLLRDVADMHRIIRDLDKEVQRLKGSDSQQAAS